MAALTLAKAAKLREEWLKFVFHGTQPSFMAGGGWPSPGTSIAALYLTLHTADPGEAGGPSTSEATYTGYTRQGVFRATGAGGWTIDEPTAGEWRSRNTSIVLWSAKSDVGTQSITHVGLATASSGGILLYRVPMPGGSVVVKQYDKLKIPALALTFREL
jgi:hypothetical protein